MPDLAHLEPWLDKRALAQHLGCSIRWIEGRMKQGMPHTLIAGRVKFRASKVEPWLETHGYAEHRGEAA